MQDTFTARRLRTELQHWISGDGYTHALTLNADRAMSLRTIQKVFGLFCHKFDKAVVGRRNVRSMLSDRRLRAVAFPEHLETNAHLHVSADLSFAISRLGENRTTKVIREAWLQATKGAGSIDLQPIGSNGWAAYQTKALQGCDYFLSAEFFPH